MSGSATLWTAAHQASLPFASPYSSFPASYFDEVCIFIRALITLPRNILIFACIPQWTVVTMRQDLASSSPKYPYLSEYCKYDLLFFSH